MLKVAELRVKVYNATTETDSQKLVVSEQSPSAGARVDKGSTVAITVVVPVDPIVGPSSVAVWNRSTEAVDLNIWMFDGGQNIWSEVGTVQYNKSSLTVDLPDGHAITLWAINPAAPGCVAGHPSENPCVYERWGGTVVGDADGPTSVWQINS